MTQPSQLLRLARTTCVSARLVEAQRRFLTNVTTTATKATKNTTVTSFRRNRWFHSTSYTWQAIKNKDAEQAKPTEEELNETEDTIPVWQNPLHHDNPEMKQMFEEDFKEGDEMPIQPLPPFETDPDKAVAPPHVEKLAHEIVNLTLLELKELTTKIADHFGFDDDVMAASYSGGQVAAAPTAEAEVVEEKTIFDLKLVGFDAKAKIKVIKEVRSIAGLGLKEAKELVEGAPKVVQKDLKQEKADELKAQLEAVGAQVEIV